MSERIKGRVCNSQQAIAVDQAALIVGSTCGKNGPQTTVERNGHLEGSSSFPIGVVPLQEMARVGHDLSQKPAEIPRRVAAASVTKIHDAGDSASIDQHVRRIELTVEQMTDRAQVEELGMTGDNPIETIDSRIVHHPCRP